MSKRSKRRRRISSNSSSESKVGGKSNKKRSKIVEGTESQEVGIVSSEDSIDIPENESDQEVSSSETSLAYVNNEATMEKAKHEEEERLVEIMCRNFGKFLSTRDAQEAMKTANEAAFQAIHERAGVLEKRCDKLEEDVKKVSEGAGGRLTQIERDMDNLKQEQRNKTVRVVGIAVAVKNNEMVDTIVNLATEKMKIKMDKSLIRAAFWVTSRDKNDRQSKQVIVKFTCEEAKREFYLARTRLKDIRPAIFINEDLTPPRAKLAAAARKAVKEKKILNSWTLDGIVYAKFPNSEKPRKIDRTADLEGLASTSQGRSEESMDDKNDSASSDGSEDPLNFSKAHNEK